MTEQAPRFPVMPLQPSAPASTPLGVAFRQCRFRAAVSSGLALLSGRFGATQQELPVILRDQEIPPNVLQGDASLRRAVSRSIRTLMEVLDLDHVSFAADGTMVFPRPGYRKNAAGAWLAQAALIREFLRLPGGRSVIPKLRNPPQFDATMFEVEVARVLAQSRCERLVVEPELSRGTADLGVVVAGRGILIECKSTREVDLKEHQAFLLATQALTSRLHDFERLPLRLDVEITSPVRNPLAAADELRARLLEHQTQWGTPASLLILPGIRASLVHRESAPGSHLQPRWHELWLPGQRIAFAPSHWNEPLPGSLRVAFPDRTASLPECREADVNVYGFVHRKALLRKYSAIISQAVGQTEGEEVIVALQCCHPEIAGDVALRKMRGAHPQLLAVWINPLRPNGRVIVRDASRSLILSLISAGVSEFRTLTDPPPTCAARDRRWTR